MREIGGGKDLDLGGVVSHQKDPMPFGGDVLQPCAAQFSRRPHGEGFAVDGGDGGGLRVIGLAPRDDRPSIRRHGERVRLERNADRRLGNAQREGLRASEADALQ